MRDQRRDIYEIAAPSSVVIAAREAVIFERLRALALREAAAAAAAAKSSRGG